MEPTPDRSNKAGSDLQQNWVDRSIALAKGIAGLCPVAGPLVAEAVGSLIPNQRIDRLTQFTLELDKRVKGIEEEKLTERLSKPQMIDLLEDGFWVAARSLSEEKIGYAATVVAEGLTGDQLEYERLKIVLDLVGQLTEPEIITLLSYSRDRYHDHDWQDQHREILVPGAVNRGSTDEDIDRSVIHAQIEAKLIRLGLLERNFRLPKKGEPPQFDKETGTLKSSGRELTRLGSIVLLTLKLTDTHF